MELASGEGELATALPVTRLPSFASHEGPAKCLPNGLPSLSKSQASATPSESNWNSRRVILADVDLVTSSVDLKKQLFVGGRLELLVMNLRAYRRRQPGNQPALAAASSVADTNLRTRLPMKRSLMSGKSPAIAEHYLSFEAQI